MKRLDELRFFLRKSEPFAGNHGEITSENRAWEEAYRQRWRHDKVVRSTHGVNCTGSCSWKIFVKNGLVTWETQQTDYPKTRPDLPDHEPRGCPRGASYSWYLYSSHRVKYPLIRARLLSLWRAARAIHTDPVAAWTSISTDPQKSAEYKKVRGLGGFVRAEWKEVEEIIAAANVYTTKTFGPDRIIGFSPIPAMSMVSYAAGSRYLSLLGGVCMSFYDWYCDLPIASPQTWGEQTDVPESADWYNSGYIICWGSNVPVTRTPDAHFLTEVRYKGTKTVAVTPDFSEVARLTDHWLKARQGTDAALAMGMVHVILKKYFAHASEGDPGSYFRDYARSNTDLPCLVLLEEQEDRLVPGRFLRAADLPGALEETNQSEWKTVVFDSEGSLRAPKGSIGFRWGEQGKWCNDGLDGTGKPVNPLLSLRAPQGESRAVAFPYFAGHGLGKLFPGVEFPEVLVRSVPVRKVATSSGERYVVTVHDLMLAHYSIDVGLPGDFLAGDQGLGAPYTPEWAEKICSVDASEIRRVALEFADNAERTRGRSMVIIGASVNHWFHSDMAYRTIISMLMLCGTLGVSGGGWAHYVGQEKLRPQSGWAPVAFALDWNRPPRHQNSTSFWYLHTNQWRYERLRSHEMVSPLAHTREVSEHAVDNNIRAERMGWLPSAPQLSQNPLAVCKAARLKGLDPKEYCLAQMREGRLGWASEDADAPENFPRVLFVWRSNLLGSSAKGHEYFLKHLLGTEAHAVRSPDLAEEKADLPKEIVWKEKAPEGKLDLLVTLDFRMSTTCIHSDIVLPTATWYEKNDLSTSDMHPFIHPFSQAVDPAFSSRSDWEIFKGIAKRFSELCQGHLGEEEDLVLSPILHDTPAELAQPFAALDWKRGQCEPIPGKTMPNMTVVKRNYPEIFERMTSVGPLLKTLGNGGKGLAWNTESEMVELGKLHGEKGGCPKMERDVEVAETILRLAPETNGHVCVKAWRSLSKATGKSHDHLAVPREHEKIRFFDLQAQPKKIISSPIWSGIESEEVSYTANYTNMTERIPWRTLTGRQQFYQDHTWMREFGEQLALYKPPVDVRGLGPRAPSNGNKEVVLNILTPHQKWGIHSTYTDNLLMLTLGRGGPTIWISEDDAADAGVVDNDWVEAYNLNGALTARAVVSQRIPAGALFMYHAQEKNVNTPLTETTQTRGIHNSISRIVMKPTHMIGGYAHQAYSFNYTGTLGTNRDEFVVFRKMNRVEWDI